MYGSRLTNRPINDTFSHELPSLSSKLYSFAEPNSRLHQSPTDQSQLIQKFCTQFYLSEALQNGPKVTIGAIALINGSDKNQVQQVLQNGNLERGISNRMSKFLGVLQQARQGCVLQPSEDTQKHQISIDLTSFKAEEKSQRHSIPAQNKIYSSRISKYATQPSPHRYLNKEQPYSPPKVVNSRLISNQKQNFKANGERKTNQIHNKSVSSSKSTNSKVFHKISIKPTVVKAKEEKSQNKSVNKQKPQNKMKNRKVIKDEKKPIEEKKKYTISKREKDMKQRKSNLQRQERKRSISIETKQRQKNSRAKSRVASSGRSSLESKRSSQQPRDMISQSRLRHQVQKLSHTQKQEQNEKQFSKHETNLLKETMEKTLAFMDMLKMMGQSK